MIKVRSLTFEIFSNNFLNVFKTFLGLDTEGLFRISANKNVVSSFRERIDKGEEFDFEKEIDDPHIIASLLKAYFVELQDPLINYEWVLFFFILLFN